MKILPPSSSGRRRNAFTLLELLAVIGVLAVLLALVFPAFRRVAANGRSAKCIGNLRQIGTALNTYLGENNFILPKLKTARASLEDDVPVIENTFDKYLNTKAIFSCPADPKYFAVTGSSYLWNNALNGQSLAALNFFNIAHEPSRIPVMADKEGFHPYLDDKVNILYADGHATKELKFWSDDKP
jgi:prepilin-type N-terminal cleavage/methylation domain-containing protein/prepilin-type processing-associated H-X9-DG protein